MSLGGGYDRSWLAELDPYGNTKMEAHDVFEDTIGCYVGDFAGMNVCNPQPGSEYAWELNPSRPGARVADGMKIFQSKGEVVKGGDPEMAALSKMIGVEVSFLQTTQQFQELVLVRYPAEVIQAKQEKIDEMNKAQLRKGPAEGFIARADPLEANYSSGGATRFRRSGHSTPFKQGDREVEVHTPDAGIVRVVDP